MPKTVVPQTRPGAKQRMQQWVGEGEALSEEGLSESAETMSSAPHHDIFIEPAVIQDPARWPGLDPERLHSAMAERYLVGVPRGGPMRAWMETSIRSLVRWHCDPLDLRVATTQIDFLERCLVFQVGGQTEAERFAAGVCREDMAERYASLWKSVKPRVQQVQPRVAQPRIAQPYARRERETRVPQEQWTAMTADERQAVVRQRTQRSGQQGGYRQSQ